MGRKTAQKDAIKQAFLLKNRPLRVSEILQIGRKTVKSLNQATVYRNLKLLVDSGWLRTINHPDLGAFYERAGKEHHHHFHCHVCNRLFEIPGCALNEKESVPSGFVTERHEIFLFGTCSSCV
jgi:Fur family ferric uptake transcriptional regulator